MNRALRVGLLPALAAVAVALGACGGDEPPDPEFAPRIEVLAPIDEAEVLTVQGDRLKYQLRVVSGLPNSCARYKDTFVIVQGRDVSVDVRNTIPADDRVACAQVYGMNERTVELGGLKPATAYRIVVNSNVELTLTTEPAPVIGQESVPAPVRDVRLVMTARTPPAYELVVSSGLESTCMTQGEVDQSRSGGRLFGNLIRVNLANQDETDPEGECAETFTPYEVSVALPGAYELGEKYELIINRDRKYEFTGGSDALRRVK